VPGIQLLSEKSGASLPVVCPYNLVLFNKGVPFLTPNLHCLYSLCIGFCGEGPERIVLVVVRPD